MSDKNFKWWVSDSEDAEIFSGPYDSREEAIHVGTGDYDRAPFYIVEADKTVMSAYVDGEAYAERIMEDLTERNEECFGEDGPDDPWAEYDKPHRSLGNAIEQAVSDWVAAHPGKTWSFHEMRNGEYITPAGFVA
ncbi:hypothetical protein GGE68_002975 [Rhizobium leguminosarum]|uniref:hypothetical protein n=1 Tax=Rhizobium leguminosarum TaxID=384 RepID=UPI0016114534|nr:hypothetical protein [Rhizobium leguminosarum]MBB5664778.1 hypothetical protein [Rhizobium leguminosarum]